MDEIPNEMAKYGNTDLIKKTILLHKIIYTANKWKKRITITLQKRG